MNQREKFELLRDEKIDENIYNYIGELFNDLNIEIVSKYRGKLIDLMCSGNLEGWCWETTETAILFMPDDSVIYRADLYFNEDKKYYHSFIEFNYEDNKYIFDPCLCMINTKNLYFNTFNVDIKGQVSAKEVKEYFINSMYSCNKSRLNFKVTEDPNAPMYRNGSDYKNIDVENNKIKSLTVHYYWSA